MSAHVWSQINGTACVNMSLLKKIDLYEVIAY